MTTKRFFNLLVTIVLSVILGLSPASTAWAAEVESSDLAVAEGAEAYIEGDAEDYAEDLVEDVTEDVEVYATEVCAEAMEEPGAIEHYWWKYGWDSDSHLLICICGVSNCSLAGTDSRGAHDFNDWSILTEPTETSAGVKTHSCWCGYSEYVDIPALAGDDSGDENQGGDEGQDDSNNGNQDDDKKGDQTDNSQTDDDKKNDQTDDKKDDQTGNNQTDNSGSAGNKDDGNKDNSNQENNTGNNGSNSETKPTEKPEEKPTEKPEEKPTEKPEENKGNQTGGNQNNNQSNNSNNSSTSSNNTGGSSTGTNKQPVTTTTPTGTPATSAATPTGTPTTSTTDPTQTATAATATPTETPAAVTTQTPVTVTPGAITNNITVVTNVTVEQEKINRVTVNKVKTIKVGKKVTLPAKYTGFVRKNFKWTISNKKYAKLSKNGVITAKKAGKGKVVKVTATAKKRNGNTTTVVKIVYRIKIKK